MSGAWLCKGVLETGTRGVENPFPFRQMELFWRGCRMGFSSEVRRSSIVVGGRPKDGERREVERADHRRREPILQVKSRTPPRKGSCAKSCVKRCEEHWKMPPTPTWKPSTILAR